MIYCNSIIKNFGNLKVLKGIDLTILQGEIISIVGQSGVGKTTLLQIMGILEKPDSGKILYQNIQIHSLKNKDQATFRNKNIGFVFQFHQLLPEFSALENIMIPALIGKNSMSVAKKKAKKLLSFLKLSDRENYKPSALSGGEKQRISIARALINQPKVIFADEPSNNLDIQNKKKLYQLFFDLRNHFNQTFVIVTHDKDLIKITDRTIFLKDGKIV